MKTLIFLSCLLLLLIGQVSAVTLSENVRFNETVSAGKTVFFDMRLSPDSTEKEVNFKSIEVTGDCSPWVTVNRTSMRFTDSQVVRAVIEVPKGSTNGMHRCDITYLAGNGGMIGYALGVPISVNVTGGTLPTVTTSATTQPTTQPTINPPPVETITAPAPMAESEPLVPMSVVIAIVALLVVAFSIVVIYEEKVRK